MYRNNISLSVRTEMITIHFIVASGISQIHNHSTDLQRYQGLWNYISNPGHFCWIYHFILIFIVCVSCSLWRWPLKPLTMRRSYRWGPFNSMIVASKLFVFLMLVLDLDLYWVLFCSIYMFYTFFYLRKRSVHLIQMSGHVVTVPVIVFSRTWRKRMRANRSL